MKWKIMLFITALISTSLAISFQMIEPSSPEYSWGNIPVSVRFLDDGGNPISNASVYAGIPGKTIQLVFDQSTGDYTGTLELLKMGTYTITAWSDYSGVNFTDSTTVFINSSKIDISVLAPTGQYGPGDIPVKLNIRVGGEENPDVIAEASITKEGEIVWEKNLEYPYNELVPLDEGNYVFTVQVSADNSLKTKTTSFTVSRENLYLEIINPKNQTYEGEVPIDVDLWSNGVFVHHANVSALIISSEELVKKISIPEAQYHYSSKVSLDPGFYTLVIEAEYNGNIVRKNVSITVPGLVEENGTVVPIPGEKPITVKEIWTDLQRRYYSPGVEGTIAVSFIDPTTGEYILSKNANVIACIYYDNNTNCFSLVPKEKPVPHYEVKFTFPKETWYEIVVNATLPGYQPVTHRFPPIKVGRPEIKPPSGAEEIENYLFTIISPERGTTYPEGPIYLRVQLLDKEGMPINDANITAVIGNLTFPLDYDINGEYSAKTEPLKAGKYTVTFVVNHNNTSFNVSRGVVVSVKKLSVEIVSPELNKNVTQPTIVIKARVTDNTGDIVPDAKVRAIVISPKTGAHTINLVRNLATGNYEIEYELDSPGEWHIKVIAEKLGYLEGSDETTFNAEFEEELRFSEREIVAGAVVIASLLVILLIVRALL